ncbi:hypothetical protein BKA70DRAFT_1445276 [Coprinopsis sp. MPI-PUGE-AT-0042]|nr:hypothetical protein BKA70DRAFT_1445276 [Coprinopsis sp. MPI-PUGE-AT-0042]
MADSAHNHLVGPLTERVLEALFSQFSVLQAAVVGNPERSEEMLDIMDDMVATYYVRLIECSKSTKTDFKFFVVSLCAALARIFSLDDLLARLHHGTNSDSRPWKAFWLTPTPLTPVYVKFDDLASQAIPISVVALGKLRKLYQGIQIAANSSAHPKVPGSEALVDDVAAALVAHFAGAPMVEPPPPSPERRALRPRPLAGGPQHSVPESNIVAPPSPPVRVKQEPMLRIPPGTHVDLTRSPSPPFDHSLSMDSPSSTTFSVREELDDEGQTRKTTRKTKKPARPDHCYRHRTRRRLRQPSRKSRLQLRLLAPRRNLLPTPIAILDESPPSAFSTPVPVPSAAASRLKRKVSRTAMDTASSAKSHAYLRLYSRPDVVVPADLRPPARVLEVPAHPSGLNIAVRRSPALAFTVVVVAREVAHRAAKEVKPQSCSLNAQGADRCIVDNNAFFAGESSTAALVLGADRIIRLRHHYQLAVQAVYALGADGLAEQRRWASAIRRAELQRGKAAVIEDIFGNEQAYDEFIEVYKEVFSPENNAGQLPSNAADHLANTVLEHCRQALELTTHLDNHDDAFEVTILADSLQNNINTNYAELCTRRRTFIQSLTDANISEGDTANAQYEMALMQFMSPLTMYQGCAELTSNYKWQCIVGAVLPMLLAHRDALVAANLAVPGEIPFFHHLRQFYATPFHRRQEGSSVTKNEDEASPSKKAEADDLPDEDVQMAEASEGKKKKNRGNRNPKRASTANNLLATSSNKRLRLLTDGEMSKGTWRSSQSTLSRLRNGSPDLGKEFGTVPESGDVMAEISSDLHALLVRRYHYIHFLLLESEVLRAELAKTHVEP